MCVCVCVCMLFVCSYLLCCGLSVMSLFVQVVLYFALSCWHKLCVILGIVMSVFIYVCSCFLLHLLLSIAGCSCLSVNLLCFVLSVFLSCSSSVLCVASFVLPSTLFILITVCCFCFVRACLLCSVFSVCLLVFAISDTFNMSSENNRPVSN